MNIGITGASGLIGRRLSDLALRRGHEVLAFSRTPERRIPGCTMRLFSQDAPPNLESCEALVHLAGESVLGLWTSAKKQRIAQSRILGTRRIAESIATMPHPPEVLVSGSAIGFYGEGGDSEILESTPGGSGFLAQTSRDWEAEALASKAGRIVLLRTGLVLAREGGALPLMARIFRLGLGGKLGSGSQWMSWIHLDDLCRLFLFCVENQSLSGPMNGTAPWPVRNVDFTKALATQVRRPAFFAMPAFALRWLGEFSHELLDSKRVLPSVACSHGFPFQFPELSPALAELL
ncbi:MAG: hypothetical protein DVB28_000244 [Verrucomicrobia bacterium]|nr:MAG: hypothetical protein DVB28_000244 [Verrucomicrobiota bacterium]